MPLLSLYLLDMDDDKYIIIQHIYRHIIFALLLYFFFVMLNM